MRVMLSRSDSSIAVVLIVGLALVSMPSLASATETDAHKIAQQFSKPAWESEKAAVERQRAAEEAEMLAKAQSEAAADVQKQQKLDAWRAKQGLPPSKPVTPDTTAADAEKAKAEQDKRRAAEAADSDRKRLEAARAAEARRLSEKLEKAKKAREAQARKIAPPAPLTKPQPVAPKIATPQPAQPDPVKPAPQFATPAKPRPTPPMALGQNSPPATANDQRVTVLLIMEPGRRGIRRLRKSADPVVCLGDRCYISKGSSTTARQMPRRFALGPGNTFGGRAGACRNQLRCVYRGVEVASLADMLQPVDLKILIHDRREPSPVSGSSGCRMAGPRLTCARMISTPTYRAWIVPEQLANSAGPGALEAALTAGLTPSFQREAGLR